MRNDTACRLRSSADFITGCVPIMPGLCGDTPVSARIFLDLSGMIGIIFLRLGVKLPMGATAEGPQGEPMPKRRIETLDMAG